MNAKDKRMNTLLKLEKVDSAVKTQEEINMKLRE